MTTNEHWWVLVELNEETGVEKFISVEGAEGWIDAIISRGSQYPYQYEYHSGPYRSHDDANAVLNAYNSADEPNE